MVSVQAVTQPRDTGRDLVELNTLLTTVYPWIRNTEKA